MTVFLERIQLKNKLSNSIFNEKIHESRKTFIFALDSPQICFLSLSGLQANDLDQASTVPLHGTTTTPCDSHKTNSL